MEGCIYINAPVAAGLSSQCPLGFQTDADKQGPPEPAQDLLVRLPARGAAPGQERQRRRPRYYYLRRSRQVYGLIALPPTPTDIWLAVVLVDLGQLS